MGRLSLRDVQFVTVLQHTLFRWLHTHTLIQMTLELLSQAIKTIMFLQSTQKIQNLTQLLLPLQRPHVYHNIRLHTHLNMEPLQVDHHQEDAVGVEFLLQARQVHPVSLELLAEMALQGMMADQVTMLCLRLLNNSARRV